MEKRDIVVAYVQLMLYHQLVVKKFFHSGFILKKFFARGLIADAILKLYRRYDMLKFSHTTLIVISGCIWLCVGLVLLPLGLNFLTESTAHYTENGVTAFPLLHQLIGFGMEAEQAAILLIALGLFIGYLKGKYVLAKSALKGIERILQFPSPVSLQRIYSKKYYILLGGMLAMGLSIKFFGFQLDVRGFVDVTIGSALINGSMVYFRQAFFRKEVAVH